MKIESNFTFCNTMLLSWPNVTYGGRVQALFSRTVAPTPPDRWTVSRVAMQRSAVNGKIYVYFAALLATGWNYNVNTQHSAYPANVYYMYYPYVGCELVFISAFYQKLVGKFKQSVIRCIRAVNRVPAPVL